MTTASVTPDTTPFSFAAALRALKAFAGAAVSVAVLGQYADSRRA
ncbi:hypothetical protein [Streptomyces sp. UNOC14_S4]|nr:hypothetical protein [Streptomyces sp. UNOC14_S4]